MHSRQEYEGSDAGLTIVNAIVEKHDGRIWIEESRVGEGTTMKFTLSKKKTNQFRTPSTYYFPGTPQNI
ncbi:MAG: hypothetical protein KKD39_00355, partial [Candidatus Altiarchaeota archaeon]|nr:hypothetical protein [Candidatus Altiarchaeota archaeon]